MVGGALWGRGCRLKMAAMEAAMEAALRGLLGLGKLDVASVDAEIGLTGDAVLVPDALSVELISVVALASASSAASSSSSLSKIGMRGNRVLRSQTLNSRSAGGGGGFRSSLSRRDGMAA